MRISCSTAWAEDVPLTDAVEAVARAGFDAIDLVVSAQTSPDALNTSIARHSLQIGGLVVTDTLDAAVVGNAAHLARELGLSGFGAWTGGRREQSLEQLAGKMHGILRELDDCDLELINRNGSRLEQLGDFRELLIRVPDTRLLIAIDTLEFHRASVNPRVAFDELADRCHRMLLRDGIADRQVPLGQGELNVRWLADQLHRRDDVIDWVVVNPVVSSIETAVDELATERKRLKKLLVAS